jgi:hypothetical protein
VLVRAALLAVGGAFMLWKARAASQAARGELGGDALLLRRVALVEGLVGVLALCAALIAVLALRGRRRRRTLNLRGDDRTEP